MANNKKAVLGKNNQLTDPSHDIWRQAPSALDVIFKPKNVAVIGATEKLGSVGRTLLKNLISNTFGGTVFPVNPKRKSVLGIKAYENIQAVPEKVDLAVISTPAETVPGVVGECVEAGVKGAIIISAGFKELGAPGAKLEADIMVQARRGNIRIIGPNCLGVMNPVLGLNATFASQMARPGNVGFISQSGALCAAILDWSVKEHVGFSSFVSIGSMLDVDWGDLIDYLSDDPHTQSILIYMETIGDARAFLSAAREVALSKPVIVLKAGSTDAAAKAAMSHTGSLAGSDEVLQAAFRRSGVLRVHEISDLFDMAEVLAKQPRPKGPKLSIITNAGGPGVLATDALIKAGGELADLSKDTINSLNTFLPPQWSHNNPVDILGDADPEKFGKTIEIVSQDPSSDGLLAILTPQAMSEPTETAEQLRKHAKLSGKPLLASWMGGSEVEPGREILSKAGIPTFTYPDEGAKMFHYMWQYSLNLKSLYETPAYRSDPAVADDKGVAQKIQEIRQSGRTVLTEVESKEILASYGIPVVETKIAKSPGDAQKFADQIGYPVVLKLYSETITHKTDVGGVKLNLINGDSVKQAYDAIKKSVTEKSSATSFQGVTVQPMIKADGYELILGSSVDPQFGPVLLFGSGGQLVEVLKDHTLALPPLNTTLARRMMERTRIFTALKGVRGRKSVDIAALEEIMVRFSQLVVEHRAIKEIDINPLIVSAERILVLDARVVLYPPSVSNDKLPKLAIRPYPLEYIVPWQTHDGLKVTIRPIRPEDEPLLVKFHHTLSEQSIRGRYMHTMGLAQRIAHERLIRVCFNDYDREIALVVDYQEKKKDAREILAVGRLSRIHGTKLAEFAIIVSDEYQNRGIGMELLKLLIDVAKKEKIEKIFAEILPDNIRMQKICERLGFEVYKAGDNDQVKASMDLSKG